MMRPDNAEFGVKIDYVSGESDPVEVFSAMTDLLRAFSSIDQVLLTSVSPGSQPVAVLDDIEAGSMTAWVKNKIEKIDDQALKDFDWKKQVGAFVVKAKYRMIEFLDDKDAQHDQQRKQILLNDLQELGILVGREVIPPTIDAEALERPMNQIQAAKSKLRNGEVLTLQSDQEGEHVVNTASHDGVDLVPTIETFVSVEKDGDMEMLLLIRKADLIGQAQWEFKFGRSTVFARIEDQQWLQGFHDGLESIVPGASMRATVNVKYDANANGDLVGSHYSIRKVHEIVPPTKAQQAMLFGDESN